MNRRAVALLVGLSFALTLLVPAAGAGANPPSRELHLSSTMLVPGQTLGISGTGWPDGTSVDVTICGANAISGSADCAVTSTATMAATAVGRIASHIQEVVPPRPCPCVVWVTASTNGLTEKIPVTIAGAPSAPVRPILPSVPPALRLSDLRVVGPWTLWSSFGGSVHRTLEFRLSNPGLRPQTPVLIGRWGSGKDLPYVITMPALHSLAPGESRSVTVPFQLKAFSIGDFTVRVTAQLVGFKGQGTSACPTSEWPILLFICLFLLVAFLVSMAVSALRRRSEPEEEPGGTSLSEVSGGSADSEAAGLVPAGGTGPSDGERVVTAGSDPATTQESVLAEELPA